MPDPKSLAFQFNICPRGKKRTKTTTCIVDGDTIWLRGVNIRLKDFDTPETYTSLCGGNEERRLGKRATRRLQELLNGNRWTIEYYGMDGSGKRRLATIRI
ncbi:MAG: thermonuclease family protein [Stappiaceae bacterium]